MSDLKADRVRFHSRFSCGNFLPVLAIALIGAISMNIVLSQALYRVNVEIRSRHEALIGDLEQIDRLHEATEPLLARLGAQAANDKELSRAIAELDQATRSATVLRNTEGLSEETASVQAALARLDHAEIAVRQTRNAQLDSVSKFDLVEAAVRLNGALRQLRGGIERLDLKNMDRVADYGHLRLWRNGTAVLALLLVLSMLAHAVHLYRQLRRGEDARFAIQTELEAERAALEKRVQHRTAALQAEVKERRRSERLDRGRNRALEMLARNEPSGDILQVLAHTVAEHQSTWTCAVHAVEGCALELVATSGLEENMVRHIRSISTSFRDAPESVALDSGRAHKVLDFGDEHTTWSELLRANGLLSVWSAPFFAKGEALGTLSVYTRLRWEPSQPDLNVLEMAGNMAALVLERSRLQAQLIEHAYHDSLTDLPNRRLARDRISSAIKRAARHSHPMAVLWIDLDRFKKVNDQYGHPVGDAVLKVVAARLSDRLRSCDTLARMGGDEFMAILEGIPTRQAARVIAADLLKQLAEPMKVDDLELRIGASIGISIYPEDGVTGDSLAQHADQAMYAAKFNCQGVCAFSPELDRETAERRELEAELNDALQTGGFTVAYQPLCLPDGKLEGFEALLRFHSPRIGNVPPSEFIPVAEETQLIIPLGEWVLWEVCRQSREWVEAGHAVVPIAVNISALQFSREDFADVVARILAETGHPGEMLVLELTESIVMNDFCGSARQMERLKELGVRIAIDDFGTGYSSLSYLHRMPIDVLKIDRSFMENLNEDEGTGPIVEAVLSMAHTLGIGVVAEGVETDAQLSTLRKGGCDVIQGYLFSKPVQAGAATAILRQGRVERGGDPVAPAEERAAEPAPDRTAPKAEQTI